ncbi:MAG: glycosyltransferase [Leptolyngbyaceae cyanobacterium SL_7_1]|nr:glycosyltransferase [Leptolyngbyaceae cyanobacterium SL_7_1]
MKVSVITVCKNSEKTLERTIRGVVQQTYTDLEYIIIDGASEDNTNAIISQYRAHIQDWVSEPDGGIYQAMNKGIQRATGCFIYFSNSDDYLFDERVIQDLVEFATTHRDCDLIYGDHEARFLDNNASIHQPMPPELLLGEMVELGDRRIHQPASFFRKELFDRLGLFDETYRIASDYKWFLRALQDSTVKVCYYPRTIVSYAHGGASANIRQLFDEVFEIQSQCAALQEIAWLQKRITRFQHLYIQQLETIQKQQQAIAKRRDRIRTLETQLANSDAMILDLHQKIELMRSSKFWQLRTAWVEIKQTLKSIAQNR